MKRLVTQGIWTHTHTKEGSFNNTKRSQTRESFDVKHMLKLIKGMALSIFFTLWEYIIHVSWQTTVG